MAAPAQLTESGSPGAIWATAESRSKLTIGSASRMGSQPTGGDAGGEIRNCLSGCGGRSVPSSEPSRDDGVCNGVRPA